MKIICVMLICLFTTVRSGGAADNPELQRIRSLEKVLDVSGVSGLLNVTREKAWLSPLIPSKWHVIHVAKTNDIPVFEEARIFGGLLATNLTEMEHAVLTGGTDADLYAKVVALLNLSDWCASTGGYGNLLLARKCTDLAALGLARLVANLKFPLKTIVILVPRLDPMWMRPATRIRVLNADAGAEIFTGTEEEDIKHIWASGGVIMNRARSSNPKDEPDWGSYLKKKLVDTPILKENMEFFKDDNAAARGRTLCAMWNYKCHERFVVGLGLRSVEEVKALIRFRDRFGHFPTEDNPNSPYRGAQGAFGEVWGDSVVKTPQMSIDEWRRERGVGIIAWRVYDKVVSGKLLPEL